MTTATLPALIQQFFTDRLCTQMEASPNTIAGYRDTFRLLLRFVSEQTGRVPTKLKIEDMDAALVGDFLSHVETLRRNSARSRNTRLAAIRSFFRFVAMCEPAYMLHCRESWPCRASATCDERWSSWIARRWMRCWPRLIAPHGSGVATMSSSSWLCRQDCEHRNSSAFVAAIS
jgi:integrase